MTSHESPDVSVRVRNFYDLLVWQRTTSFTVEIYRLTQKFPASEQFGLISQMRRAASSIGANIAEGFERHHFKDTIRFYYQARASLAEVQNFLLLGVELDMVQEEHYKVLDGEIVQIRKMLNGLIRATGK